MVEKKLISIIKKISGSLVCFGIDNIKLTNTIDSNDNIYYCDLLNSNCECEDSSKGENIYIKSIRKNYKRKTINYVIINIENIDITLAKVIQDSIYICNKNIYLYTNNLDCDINNIIKKCERYNVIINQEKCKNGYIINVDVTKAKNNKIKDFIYHKIDILTYIFDKIGDVMS